MRLLKNVFCGFLMLSLLNLYFPKLTFAKHRILIAKSDAAENKPRMVSTPQEYILGEEPKPPEPPKPAESQKPTSRKWLWIVLGVLVIGGGVGVAMGGGGDFDTGDSSDNASTKSLTWTISTIDSEENTGKNVCLF